MNLINISDIDLTHEYLNKTYELTKDDYIDKKYIITEKHKGHNLKSLVQQKKLIEANGKYKWNSSKPYYAQSYDYFNVVRNRKRTYAYLLEILKFPDKASADDILEAISVKDSNELSIKSEPKMSENLSKLIGVVNAEFDLKSNIKEKPETVLLSEREENKLLLEELLSRHDGDENRDKIITELLTKVITTVMENTEATRSNQNSLSMAIAVLKTNQANLFDLVAVQYNLLKDLISNYSFTNDPKDVERKKNLSDVLLYLKKRVDSNTNLINRYSK